jgi:universal stress protein A
MLAIGRILCATDFSAASRLAVEAAVAIAEKFQAELILLHSIAPLPFLAEVSAPAGYPLAKVEERLEKEARLVMDELVSMVPGQVKLHTRIVHGKASDQIIRLAEEESVDLIVLGSHGESGWRDLVLGEVTDRVVRSAPFSVLTVRQPPQ